MKGAPVIHTFIYNSTGKQQHVDSIVLDYRAGPNRNVTFAIPKFIELAGHIPDRYLDLLELASYVYCADRYISRGQKDSPYSTGWQRHFLHIVSVRDFAFWSRSDVVSILEKLLSFLSGDIHKFEFRSGHKTLKAGMFDNVESWPIPDGDYQIAMFSGGLDSTSGAFDTLVNTQKNLLLVSHVSRTSTVKTQRLIIDELNRQFQGRVHHLKFQCNLHNYRAPEETQRTRSFLYTAVGAAIAKAYKQNNICFFENGVLSVNLPPCEQFQNARATRTTHPKTLYLLSELLTKMNEKEFKINNPFFWMTKADITLLLKKNGGLDLLNNTVSCSRTFDDGVRHSTTHCGRCSQCIDRRFGLAAADMLDDDNRGLYAYDFVIDNICPSDDEFGREERTMLVDYIRLAQKLRTLNIDAFEDKWLDQLSEVVDYIDGQTEVDKIEQLYKLFNRHGCQIKEGIITFQRTYAEELLGRKTTPNSLSEILATKEYLDAPPRLLAKRISETISASLPIAFQNRQPVNEHEVQDQVEALLKDHSDKLIREFPHIRFALSKSVPDFSRKDTGLYIEIKYTRGKTTPSKVNGEIAEDCTKYPANVFLLFIVYDPERRIKDKMKFASDFENKRECSMCIIQ